MSGAAIVSSPSSASTPSRPRPRRPRTRSATCPSASWLARHLRRALRGGLGGAHRHAATPATSTTPPAIATAVEVMHKPWVEAVVSAGASAGDDLGAARLPARPAAHLHVDGPRRPPAAVLRQGAPALPHPLRDDHPRRRRSSASPRSSPTSGGAADLTNIGTFFAFVLVCIDMAFSSLGPVIPDAPRAFRTPLGSTGAGSRRAARACPLMLGLPWITWIRFGLWLVVGLVVYFWSRIQGGARSDGLLEARSVSD